MNEVDWESTKSVFAERAIVSAKPKKAFLPQTKTNWIYASTLVFVASFGIYFNIAMHTGYVGITDGNSMEPTFHSGDIAFSNPFDHDPIQKSDLVIAYGHLIKKPNDNDFDSKDSKDGYLVKRFVKGNLDGTYQLSSDNPASNPALGTDPEKLHRIAFYLDICGFKKWIATPWREHREEIHTKKYRVAMVQKKKQNDELEQLKKNFKPIPMKLVKGEMPLTASVNDSGKDTDIHKAVYDFKDIYNITIYSIDCKSQLSSIPGPLFGWSLYLSTEKDKWGKPVATGGCASSKIIKKTARYAKWEVVADRRHNSSSLQAFYSISISNFRLYGVKTTR